MLIESAYTSGFFFVCLNTHICLFHAYLKQNSRQTLYSNVLFCWDPTFTKCHTSSCYLSSCSVIAFWWIQMKPFRIPKSFLFVRLVAAILPVPPNRHRSGHIPFVVLSSKQGLVLPSLLVVVGRTGLMEVASSYIQSAQLLSKTVLSLTSSLLHLSQPTTLSFLLGHLSLPPDTSWHLLLPLTAPTVLPDVPPPFMCSPLPQHRCPVS